MWPDVLLNISQQIGERLAAIDEAALIYLGSSKLVPNVNQINVYRGDLKPDEEGRYCEGLDDNVVVFIDVWVSEDVDPEGLTDLEYENSRTLTGYQKLNAFSQAIRATEFEAEGYTASLVRVETDNDQFRPTFAERIEYLAEMRN